MWVFTIYGHGGHLVQWCGTILCFRQKAPSNLVKINDAVSEKKTFKDNTILYMYIAPRQGKITPVAQKVQPLVFITFCENDFSTFPHTKVWGCKFDLAVKIQRSS